MSSPSTVTELEAPTGHPTEADVRRLMRELPILFPTEYPVRFKRTKIKSGCMGTCDLVRPRKEGKTPYFRIEIDSRLSPPAQWFCVIHEYAHALQWRGPVQESHRQEEHDIEWSVPEANIWNAFGG